MQIGERVSGLKIFVDSTEHIFFVVKLRQHTRKKF